jgi:hypothetical protein
MMRMLYTVSLYHFNRPVISFQGKTHLVYRVTFLDLFKDPFIPFGVFGGLVKTSFNGAKKAVMFV